MVWVAPDVHHRRRHCCCCCCRHWCNRPTPEVSKLAAALNPAGNAFRLSDVELVVIHKADSSRTGKRDAAALPAAAAGEAAVQADGPTAAAAAGSHSEGGQRAHDVGSGLTAAELGHRRTVHGSRNGAAGGTIHETVVGPVVKCSCETDIFNALGLAYVPPHLRNLISGGVV